MSLRGVTAVAALSEENKREILREKKKKCVHAPWNECVQTVVLLEQAICSKKR